MDLTGLTLHAVRILGFASTDRVAARFGLDPEDVAGELRRAETFGWIAFSEFGDSAGWSLTDSGRNEGERMLAEELARTGAENVARAVLERFEPLNAIVRRACTDWQLRPTGDDPFAPNDHADPEWDAGVLLELGIAERALPSLLEELTARLPRVAGYPERFAAARRRASRGETAWVVAMDRDSCHRVWFELHEDLLATNRVARA